VQHGSLLCVDVASVFNAQVNYGFVFEFNHLIIADIASTTLRTQKSFVLTMEC